MRTEFFEIVRRLLINGKEIKNEFERAISLRVIDSNWVEHMNTMEHLKEGIGLRGYSQTNPVQAYTMEGFELFDKLLDKIDNDIAKLNTGDLDYMKKIRFVKKQ